jgi:hypothetical protein
VSDYPDVWVKRPHTPGCDGNLFRTIYPPTVCVDRLGRIGNGGIVAHVYTCNVSWRGCPARVLVSERAVRNIAVEALSDA